MTGKILFAVSFLFGVVTAAAFTVSENGAPHATIVIAADAPEPVRYAAERLQSYVQRISGARLPIATDADTVTGPRILVGASRATGEYGVNAADLGEQEYLIRTVGDDLILAGRDGEEADAGREIKGGHTFCNAKLFQAIGTVYAVNDFLMEFCGVRWFLPGELGEVVPATPTLVIPEVDRRRSPSVKHRNFHAYCWLRKIPKYFDIQYNSEFGEPAGPYLSDAESLDWARALKMGGRVFSGGHGQMDYFRRFGAAHPDWFANGQPEEGGQLCYSNPGLRAEIIQDAGDFLDGKFSGEVTFSAGNYFSVMPADNQAWCRCDACRKSFPQLSAQDPWLPPSQDYASYYVWSTVADLAREVAKTHPEAKIVCCAYADYVTPPENLELPENVTVFLCQTHSAYAASPEAKREHDDFVRAWRAKTANLIFWDYYLWPVSPTFERFPASLPHTIADQIQLMRELQLDQGFMAQMSETMIRNLAIDHLRIYITARLLDDWTLPVDALLEEYYRLFYGPAEAPMREFWTRLEDIYTRERPPSAEYRDAEYDWMVMVRPDDMTALEDCLDRAARSVAPDSVYKQRIDLMRRGILDWLNASRERVLRQIAGTKHATVPHLAAPAHFDGGLTDPVWRQAATLADWQMLDGSPAPLATTAKVFRTDTDLYVGIRCAEPDMAGLRSERTKHDDAWLFRDDSVELFLDVGRKLDDKRYFHLTGNSVGTLRDSYGRNGIAWESNAEVAAARDADGWSVAMRIPLASLGVTAITPGERWGLNVCRTRPVRQEHESVMQNENYTFYNWNGPFGYHNPMRFGVGELE